MKLDRFERQPEIAAQGVCEAWRPQKLEHVCCSECADVARLFGKVASESYPKRLRRKTRNQIRSVATLLLSARRTPSDAVARGIPSSRDPATLRPATTTQPRSPARSRPLRASARARQPCRAAPAPAKSAEIRIKLIGLCAARPSGESVDDSNGQPGIDYVGQ